jgi:DNA-binding NarL/FixJ family response regulator
MSAGSGPGPASVRVVVADGNPLIRMGVRAALSGHTAIRVVGEASDASEAVALARSVRPDVVLLGMPASGRDGLSVVAELAGAAAVVMLTGADEPETVARVVESGATGYLLHGTYDLGQLADAVLGAACGLPYASPAATTALVQAIRRRPPPAHEGAALAAGALSTREREVMSLVAGGLANREVGRCLGLSEKTVKNHLQSIYAKLGVHGRAAALSVWLGAAAGRDEATGGRTG